ncbi:MAG TPA: glycosyltransferase [Terriglobales bacterium]|nr:glycosyltransferase [Terriglobales bacterium]
MKSSRILCTGESWYGATGRACTASLRQLGCDVTEVNIDNYVPQWRRKSHRTIGRLIFPIARKEFNEALLHMAWQQNPVFFLAFKGPYVEVATLRKMRSMGIKLYNYYPDTSAFSHGPMLPKSLPEYDCIFYTKPFWDADVRKRVPLQESVFLAHGYDEELHKPWPLTDQDRAQYDVDVAVIGSSTPYKEKVLGELLTLRPKLNLKIWGDRWETCKDERILNCWQLGPLTGQSYSRALQKARINLAIMSGKVNGASQGDDVTTRTFQIPASRGFMLHERNTEVLTLFEEGKEIACFASPQELVEKLDFYLAHPAERVAIAEAGYRRCVPAYSYSSRMTDLLQWHAASVRRGVHAEAR